MVLDQTGTEAGEAAVAEPELLVSILIPCLNEAETLPACIREARAAIAAAGLAGEVLVADNGSTDGSLAVAAAGGARVIHVASRGYGNALAGGIAAARGRFVLIGDADGSYDFGALPDFLAALSAGADLVIGCRLPSGGGRILPGAMPWKHRWIGNPILTAVGRLFFTAPVHDFHCGLRAFRRDAIVSLGLQCPGMEFASEMVVRATFARLTLAEVPVTLRPDRRTRRPHLRSWRDGWRHLRFMLLFSPRWLYLVPGLSLALASLAVFLRLMVGPVQIGSITFDVSTLILASAGLVVGVQTVLLGMLAKAFAVHQGIAPPTPLLTRLQRLRPVELGIVSGAVLVLLGLGHVLLAVVRWGEADFGELPYPQGVRVVVPAVTLAALGIQLAFSGFALAILEFGREIRLKRAESEPALAAVDAAHRPRLVIVLVGAALLSWPSVLNWHPYLFWDTYGYFLQGKAYAQLLLGWAGLGPPPAEAATGWIGAAGRMLARDPSIRSPTWSLLSWGLAAGGGFWLLALLDALVAAATVELFLARLLGVAPGRRVAVMAGMALLTSLPWFASYLMPDLYAGLMILAVAMLAFAWPALTRIERGAVLALYLLSITFHSSHLLLAVGLVVPAALLPVVGGRRAWRALRLGLPIAGAVALLLAASWLGFGRLTLTPQGAPFLLARSWEDGPGRAYLEAACPGAGWAICPYVGRLAGTAQGFLWRPDESYWSMDPATRAAVRAEEQAILLRALAADPWRQVRAALANGAVQLSQLGLDDLVLGRGAMVTPDDYTFVYLPTAPAALWGLGGFSAIIYVTVVVALGGLLVWAARQRAPAGDPLVGCVLLVLAALILNAAICGALSGAHPRYQSRVVWLVPLLAAGLLLRPATAVTAARRAPAPAAP